MGFEVYYRSTRPVSPAEAEAIDEAAGLLCDALDSLRWEEVCFYDVQADGHLSGGSKPHIWPPHGDAAATAERQPLPAARDLLDILSQLSREHGIDWEISHDYSDGAVGYIRGGTIDANVVEQIDQVIAEAAASRRLRAEGGT